MKQITPPFTPVFPPTWSEPGTPPAPLVSIGHSKPGRTLMRIDLTAYGAEPVTVHARSVLQRVAFRAAVMYARLKLYGPTRRITGYTLRYVES